MLDQSANKHIGASAWSTMEFPGNKPWFHDIGIYYMCVSMFILVQDSKTFGDCLFVVCVGESLAGIFWECQNCDEQQ